MCWVLCLLAPVGAQETTTPTEDQYSGDECENPQTLATLGPETSDDRKEFETTTDRFLVTYEVDFESDDPLDFRLLEVDITDRFGLVEFDEADRDASKSFVVIEDPGKFAVETDVTPNNGATYTVKVEECPGSAGGGGTTGGSGGQPAPVDNPKGVMPGTSAKKIPNTGGPPYLVLGAVALLAGSILAGRGVLRR